MLCGASVLIFSLSRWVDMPNLGGILRLGGEHLTDLFSTRNLNYAYMPFLIFTMPSDCRLHIGPAHGLRPGHAHHYTRFHTP
jgi:hypothetical protein